MKRYFLLTLIVFVFTTRSAFPLIRDYSDPGPPPDDPSMIPPAPIRGTHVGLSAAAMLFPVVIIAGVAAIILTSEGHKTSHSH